MRDPISGDDEAPEGLGVVVERMLALLRSGDRKRIRVGARREREQVRPFTTAEDPALRQDARAVVLALDLAAAGDVERALELLHRQSRPEAGERT